MTSPPILALGRSDIAALLSVEECISAVESAFCLYGSGKADPPGILGVHVDGGGFHIKAGTLDLRKRFFAAKVNANFPGNRERFGLPTIQGLVILCDAENGCPLALMDSAEITGQRTAAATAVAVRYLARPDSQVLAICGCGEQARYQCRALQRALPLKKVYLYDIRIEQANDLAKKLSLDAGVEVSVVSSPGEALHQSDVCVTCTTSQKPFVFAEDIRAGTLIAAVGADNPNKHEIASDLLAASTVVADVAEQCASIGDLHHAISAGLVARDQIYAELGEIVAGQKPGRTSDDEIIVFDSTGMALQDVAAAAVVYEKARNAGCGTILDLSA